MWRPANSDNPCLPDGTPFPFWDDTTRYTHTYHVACEHPRASDNNPGTDDEPFATINRAASVAGPAECILVHRGTYRECVRPARGGDGPDRMIWYRAAPGEVVRILGSERWQPDARPCTDWITDCAAGNAAAVWSAGLPAAWFTAGYNPFSCPNMTADYTTFKVQFSTGETRRQQLRRGLVYVNGHPLRQVLTPSGLAAGPGVFWVEEPGLRLHFRLPGDAAPGTRSIEVTTREQVFAPLVRGLGYVRVSGFVLAYAGNAIPKPQRGLLSAARGHHWILEDNTVQAANGLGIDVGAESNYAPRPANPEAAGGHIVRRNRVRDCGVCGLAADANNRGTLIEDNLFEDIGHRNIERAWECGGIKLHRARDVLLRRNVIRRLRHAPGIWLDYLNSNCRVTGNVIADIESISGGIYVEATHAVNLLDHNVLWNIRRTDCPTSLPFSGPGINVDAGEGCIVAHNLVARVADSYAILVHLTQNDRIVNGRYGLCRSHKVLNNLVLHSARQVLLAHVADNLVDGNAYGEESAGPAFCIEHPAPAAQLHLDAWRTFFGLDAHGSAVDIKADLDVDRLVLTLSATTTTTAARGVAVAELHDTLPPGGPGPFPLTTGRRQFNLASAPVRLRL